MSSATAILLTQVPIALGCFWLAWELRRLRRSVEKIVEDDSAELSERRDRSQGP